MSNRNSEQRTVVVITNDDDDGVSCVTSSSRRTLETETETLSNIELELLQVPALFVQLINNGDIVQFRRLLSKYFTEDCWFQSPTMDTPVFGIEHVMTTVKGLIQNLPDFILSATNIQFIQREVVNGTVVSPRCILFERNFVGNF